MTEEVLEQAEPIVVETKGKWLDFEIATRQTFEVGKTYKITVGGNCLFAISPTQPTYGFGANEITYTKEEGLTLWIYTK